jgi:hypothetical protein
MTSDGDELLTRNAAAEILGRDRRTIHRALNNMLPDQPAADGQPAKWRRSTIVRALGAHEARTAPWRGGRGGDNETLREQAADALERAAIRMDGALDRLRREPDLEKRRGMFYAGIPEVGELDRAFADAQAVHPYAELVEPWVDQTMRQLMAEVLALVQIKIGPTSPA